MQRPINKTQQGWISVPILILLLAAGTFSVYFQQDLLADWQWRKTLQQAQVSSQIPDAFKAQYVQQPNFSLAQSSPCVGFCELTGADSGNLRRWANNKLQVWYQWSQWQNAQGGQFHRLCASLNQHAFHCWWWREQVLQSHGWVALQE